LGNSLVDSSGCLCQVSWGNDIVAVKNGSRLVAADRQRHRSITFSPKMRPSGGAGQRLRGDGTLAGQVHRTVILWHEKTNPHPHRDGDRCRSPISFLTQDETKRQCLCPSSTSSGCPPLANARKSAFSGEGEAGGIGRRSTPSGFSCRLPSPLLHGELPFLTLGAP